ncbi:hypothetical protein BN873_470119 [Candidatus Competibacter denitrificans Run_A_D11]|uniref:Uncharacterized protein n=1 Tax=Candidatus Competibacter denitrificans Run_A_D11 TaxID=1400863 RepID=W6M6R3_9GAMM|nr:hypothetical protein BN873_470119 [Candidatus Competibacter denitrificans Run_A_D11]
MCAKSHAFVATFPVRWQVYEQERITFVMEKSCPVQYLAAISTNAVEQKYATKTRIARRKPTREIIAGSCGNFYCLCWKIGRRYTN